MNKILKQNGLMITGSLVVSTAVMVDLKWGLGIDRPFITYPELEK